MIGTSPDCKSGCSGLVPFTKTSPHITLSIRPCDSTNLNVSPLCDITDPQAASQVTAWGQAARDTYSQLDTMPGYVDIIQGPTRQFYINMDRMQSELLTSLIEVRNKAM